MVVASLLDLGADQEVLMKALNSLPVDGFRIKISRVKKSGLDACDFDVLLDEEYENHDHDMEYLHPNSQETHSHEHGHKHTHEHHHHHSHVHRGLGDIIDIIEKADLTARARALTIRIFEILASAEAKAHGVPVGEVHFHEVGAVDSIVDIVAASVCLDNLDITEAVIPCLYEGTGYVKCQHGMIPVPVPAVANIAAEQGLTLKITDTQGEFVTPTGAAIAAAIKSADKLPESFTIEKIGLGAGKRKYERPSIVRAMLIEKSTEESDYIYKLETNVDDCTGEMLGYVLEQLFDAGARDVSYIPLYMKKNRPAYQINVICTEEDVPKMEEIIFRETTTIGIRKQKMERTIIRREIQTIMSSLGAAQVKICYLKSGVRAYPEYNSVIELCKKHQMSYPDVFQLIERESKKLLSTEV